MTSSYTWPLSFRSEGWFKLWLHCLWFMAPSLPPPPTPSKFWALACSHCKLMDTFLSMDCFNHSKQMESFKKDDVISGSCRNVFLSLIVCLCLCGIWIIYQQQWRTSCFGFFSLWHTAYSKKSGFDRDRSRAHQTLIQTKTNWQFVQ